MRGEIRPGWVFIFDEADFLFAAPGFYLLFAIYRYVNVGEDFKVDQAGDFVLGGEGGGEALAVLHDAALEVIGYAGVEGSGTASEDVDVVGF